MNADGVVRKSGGSVAPGNLAAQHRTDGAVNVTNRELDLDRRESFERVMHLTKNLVVERLLQAMVLLMEAASCDAGRNRRVVEDRGEVESLGLPVILPMSDRGIHFDHVDAADHLVHRTEAHFRHVLAN